MRDGFRIRRMVEDDISAIMPIELDSFDDPWSAFAFACEIRHNPRCVYLVAEDRDGRVDGYAGFWWGKAGATLLKIAVAEQQRGTGLAKRLLEAIEDEARNAHQRIMRLEVAESNNRARRFYEKHSYSQVGIIERYYARTSENACVYEKSIAN